MQPFIRIDSREGPSRYQRVSEAKGIVIAVRSQDISHITVKSQWKPFHQRKRHMPLHWKSQHRSNQFSTTLCLEQLVTMTAVQFIRAIRTALNSFHVNQRRQKIMPWPLTETPLRTRKKHQARQEQFSQEGNYIDSDDTIPSSSEEEDFMKVEKNLSFSPSSSKN